MTVEAKNRRNTWISALLSIFLTCLYPCLFIFSQNAGEARAVDMLPFLGIFLATALIMLGVLAIVFRDLSRAAFTTCLGMLVVINFSLVAEGVTGLMPWFHAKYLLVLVVLVGCGLIALLLKKKPNMTVGCILVAIAFGAMSLVSVFTAIPKLLTVLSYAQEAEEATEAGVETISGEKPNVYYLLFDEYGGDENLMTYFGFDNSAFYEELESRGFTVSHTTYNTESCWTDTLVPNLLNMDYVASDDMPEKTRRTYLENPYMVELLEDSGYQVNVINHRAYLRIEGARELTEGQVEDNISEYLLSNSLFNKIDYFRNLINRQLFVSYRDNYAEPLNNSFNQLMNCWQEAKNGPTLTVSYIQSPHAPFVFNNDGSLRDLSTGWYWKDESLYPGQLQYVNTLILQAIDNIQENDPAAVILLMSDHGARVPLHMVEQFGGPRFDAVVETPVMQSALCSVYVPGGSPEIEGMTGINAARTVFNAAFGTELPMIPPAEGYVLPEIYNARESTGSPGLWEGGNGSGFEENGPPPREDVPREPGNAPGGPGSEMPRPGL